MALRTVTWTAIGAARLDRVQLPAGFIAARTRCEGFARFRARPLVTASGAFDRSAIMAAAVAAAREHQARHGGTWGQAMAVCLRASWQAARVARSRSVH